MINRICAVVCLALLTLAGCGGRDQGPASAGVDMVGPVPPLAMTDKPRNPDRTQRERVPADAVLAMGHVALSPLPLAQARAQLQQANRLAGAEKGVQVALARELPALAQPQGLLEKLRWQVGPDGRQRAALRLDSPEAAGLRAGLRFERLPRELVLRFHGPDDAREHVFAAADIETLLAANRSAAESDEDARMFWSPYIDGAAMVVVLELPAGVSTRSVSLSVPVLSHFAASPLHSQVLALVGDSSGCNVDYTCQAGQDDWAARATTRLLFTREGSSYLCSGTAIVNRTRDYTPLVLTARHCISSQAVASTVQSFWLYQSGSCNGNTVSPSAVQLNGGAWLAESLSTTDATLLWLNKDLPTAAAFAGWDVNPPALFQPVRALHHPQGDVLKLSTGFVQGFAMCSTSTVSSTFSCMDDPWRTGTFLSVQFSRGITEMGSSGSGLFTHDQNQYLLGQLYGGDSSCSNPQGTNRYGRLDRSYSNGLMSFKPWMDGAPLSVPPSLLNLNLQMTGWGTGWVNSTPAGLQCRSSCSATFARGQVVTLTAVADTGSTFMGWSGACSNAVGTCTVTLYEESSVSAHFVLNAGVETSVVREGGFEGGATGWTFSDGDILSVNPDGVGPSMAGSQQLAWLCGYSRCDDQMSQGITVPDAAQRSWLSLDLLVRTAETSTREAYDTTRLMLTDLAGKTLAVLGEWSNLSKITSWTRWWTDLTAWAGKTVNLLFVAKGDALGTTSFFVDNVAVRTAPPDTLAEPESGWWWNAAESGRGFAIERQGSMIFMAAFVYDETGKPVWYAGLLNRQAMGRYTGQLREYAGGQAFGGAYRAPAGSKPVADAVLSAWAPQEAVLLIQPVNGGPAHSITIERFGFGRFAQSAVAYESGWWWNASQSGTGFFVENQGASSFMTVFTYDGTGRPTWYGVSYNNANVLPFGSWDAYSDGQGLAGAYRPPELGVGPGSVVIGYRDTTLTLTTQGQDMRLQRFRFGG